MLTKIRFFLYYSKFIFMTTMGLHETLHPRGMRWRWRLWQRWRQDDRRLGHWRSFSLSFIWFPDKKWAAREPPIWIL